MVSDFFYSNADAVVEQENGKSIFVEPHEVQEDFNEFFSYVQEDSENISTQSRRNVKYAQTRRSSPVLQLPCDHY